ncbi:MAG: hypothetical protein ABL959_17470 [Pyrinomonadaceae bacterium]
MKKLTILPALFLVFLIAQLTFAQNNPSNKETLIKASQILEAQPFQDKAKDFRSWAMRYVIETDDVSVTICSQILTAVMDKKNKSSSELLAQYTIAMAAYKLSNPDKAKDDNLAQLAGLESTLKAYENILKEKPKNKFQAMDDLLAKREKGELKKFVEEGKCGEGKTEPIK